MQFAIPTLETERLILRAFSEDDFAPMCAFYGDECTAHFVGGKEEPRLVWRRIASYIGHWALRGYGMWALEAKDDQRFVGYVGNWYPDGWAEPEIAYGLMAKEHGKGFATEAAKRALQYAYEILGWRTAISAVDVNNTGSKRVAERLGATFEGSQQVSFFQADIYRYPSPENMTF